MGHRLLARGMLGGCALLLAVTACGSGSSGGDTSVNSAPTTHQLDDRSNGSTVDVQLGDTIVVTLHNTYWTLAVPTAALQPLGAPQASPSPCAVAGSGCGSVTQSYNAGHVGRTTLHAHRDSCGEALRCSAQQSDWSVTVRVS
jgi:hypothetical protein